MSEVLPDWRTSPFTRVSTSKSSGLDFRFDVRPDRTKGIEAFGASKLYVGFLQIAGGHVVHTGVTQNITQRILVIVQMRASAANNQTKFAFVLHALRIFCEDDCLRRTDDGSRWLQKNQRLLGDFVAKLRGMSGIVAPDADNFSRLDRCQQTYRGQRPGLSYRRPFGPCGRRQFLNIVAIQNAVSRNCRITGGVGRNKSAEFHLR